MEVFQQQDVQELSRVLFDVLEEAMKSSKSTKNESDGADQVTDEIGASENASSIAEADSGVNSSSSANGSIINELYGGTYIDYIQCVDIPYKSERKDTFLDLSLSITKNEYVSNTNHKELHLNTLEDCLVSYLTPEILDGDNQYYADEPFNRKVNAIKGLKFVHLPKILSIQLKRFVYDFNSMSFNAYGGLTQKKLNTQVKFPFILDMNPYVCHPGADVEAGEEGVDRSAYPFEAFLQKHIDKLMQHQDKEEGEAKGDVEAGITTNSDLEGLNTVSDSSSCPQDVVNLDTSTDLYDTINENPITAVCGKQNMPHKMDGTDTPAEYNDHGSITNVELRDMVVAKGEWIYELYGVLIHAGACGGGHYYAYIKDLETKKWNKFNDSTVTPVSLDTVREAWGGDAASGSGNVAGSVPSYYRNYQTGSNAYLLLYHKVELVWETHVAGASVSQVETGTPAANPSGTPEIRPITYPPESVIPPYILEEARKTEQLRIEKEREAAEKWNILHIRLGYDSILPANSGTSASTGCIGSGNLTVGLNSPQSNPPKRMVHPKRVESVLNTKKQATYREVLQQIYDEYSMWKEWDGDRQTEITDSDSFQEPDPTTKLDVNALHDTDAGGIVTDVISETTNTAIIVLPPVTCGINDANNRNNGVGGHLTSKPCPQHLSHLRLRRYASYQGGSSLKEPIPYSQLDTPMLQLHIYDYMGLFLEIRRDLSEPWEDYIEDGLNLSVIEFVRHYKDGESDITSIGSFAPPRSLRIAKSSTLRDLRKIVARWVAKKDPEFRYPEERLRLLRLLSVHGGTSATHIELGMSDLDKNICTGLNLFDNVTIYFEDSCGVPIAQSNAMARFLYDANIMSLRFNRPGAGKQINGTPFPFKVEIDRRSSVLALREAIAHVLNAETESATTSIPTSANTDEAVPMAEPLHPLIDPMHFRMYVNGNKANEIINTKQSIMDCAGIYTSYRPSVTNILLEDLGAIPIGHSPIDLFMLDVPGYVPGICNSPIAENKPVVEEIQDVVVPGSVIIPVPDSAVAVAVAVPLDDGFSDSDMVADGASDTEVCVGDLEDMTDSHSDIEQYFAEEQLDGRCNYNTVGIRPNGKEVHPQLISGNSAVNCSYPVATATKITDLSECDEGAVSTIDQDMIGQTDQAFEARGLRGTGSEIGPAEGFPTLVNVEDVDYVPESVPGFTEEQLATGDRYVKATVSIDFSAEQYQLISNICNSQDEGDSGVPITFSPEMTIGECKLIVLEKLIACGRVKKEYSQRAGIIRLRDRCKSVSTARYALDRIWKPDEATLTDAQISLFEHKDVVVQVLDRNAIVPTDNIDHMQWTPEIQSNSSSHTPEPHAEDLSQFGNDSCVVLMQKFDRTTRLLGHIFELCIDMNLDVDEVRKIVCDLTHIDPEHLRVMIPQSNYHSPIRLCKLHNMVSKGYSQQGWCDLSDHINCTNAYSNRVSTKKLKELYWSVKDGTMILFQDVSVDLRPLTSWERRALEDEAISHQNVASTTSCAVSSPTAGASNMWSTYDDVSHNTFNNSNSSFGAFTSTPSSYGTAVPMVTSNAITTTSTSTSRGMALPNSVKAPARPVQKGIKIKSRSDREREQVELELKGMQKSKGLPESSSTGSLVLESEDVKSTAVTSTESCGGYELLNNEYYSQYDSAATDLFSGVD